MKDQRFIYNSASGGLYFDADGNGIGAVVQIAQLNTALLLSASDFAIVA